jgi:hypothetical protein
MIWTHAQNYSLTTPFNLGVQGLNAWLNQWRLTDRSFFNYGKNQKPQIWNLAHAWQVEKWNRLQWNIIVISIIYSNNRGLCNFQFTGIPWISCEKTEYKFGHGRVNNPNLRKTETFQLVLLGWPNWKLGSSCSQMTGVCKPNTHFVTVAVHGEEGKKIKLNLCR